MGRSRSISRWLTWIAAASIGMGCSAAGSSGQDFGSTGTRGHSYDPEQGEVTPTSSAVNGIFDGTVGEAVSGGGCSTESVAGLASQVVEAVNCLHPNAFARVPDKDNLSMGSAAFPYMQKAARDGLVQALDAKPGSTLHVSSMLRTLVQQYLLYAWSQKGSCGISIAARPGHSNHESGIALDTGDYSAWKSTLTNAGFSWYGSDDKVHFDFEGGGTVALDGEDVRAFQLLWNVKNPNDKIGVDGDYGPTTESKLRKTNAGGFPGVVDCSEILAEAHGKGDAPGNPGPVGSGGSAGSNSGGSGGAAGNDSPGAGGGNAGGSGGGTAGCGNVSYEGECQGDVLSYCEGSEVKTIDCAAKNAICSWNASKSYYDCVASGAGGTGGSAGSSGAGGSGGSASECGSITYVGECTGSTLQYCQSDTLVTVDCSSQGATCEYNSSAGFYECVASGAGGGGGSGGGTGCGSVTEEGECWGDELSYCSGGQLVTMSCTDYGKSCTWNSSASYYDCM
ncbi:MAG: D-alanyl-D-alanine carboxypeptidase family protein [Deltaproteobacteria bacterium]|nr:D-alanyl-D-alanine carboxypeptidase family protein [Deltaproteobacteria bacterium]